MGSRRIAVVVALLAVLGLGGAPGADAIVGGSQVPAGGNPFMASLRLDGSHRCGGSVIGSQWVLTAAHCVEGVSPISGFTVAVGNVDRTAGRVIQVDGVAIHPGYDTATSANDAALLHLAAPAGVPTLRLAAVGEDQHEADGAPVRVAGWGSELSLIVTSVPSISNRMKQVDLTVVGDADCSDIADAATQVCAEAFLGDSCQGDSGGPLFATTPSGPVQVGVVSYGFGCAVPTFAGVYSEVNNPGIRNWIRSTTAGI